MSHCETCRCEERARLEPYYAAMDEYSRYLTSGLNAAFLRLNEAMSWIAPYTTFRDPRTELKPWAAEQDLNPPPENPWRPYRPELAAPFYGKETPR